MTERFAETTRRLDSLRQLDVVVTAMRGIAASRAQQARALVPGVRAYAAVIGEAIGQALALAEPGDQQPGRAPSGRAVVLFAAEQGFAGAFNDRMLAALDGVPQPRDVFLIGTRGATLAAERHIRPQFQAAMVTHANLVPPLAGRIAEALYDWLAAHPVQHVDLIVPTWSASGGVLAAARPLLPFDFGRFAAPARAQPPLVTLSPARLLAQLAQEYVFAELCEAALSAFAAENEARMAAMLAAKSHLDDMETELVSLAKQIRQEEITAEVVELASGAIGAAIRIAR